MKTYTCILIDDEPLAIEILSDYLSKIPDFRIVGTYTNSFEAYTYIESNEVDLIFCDIQMPELNGLQLAKLVKGKLPHIIFTTAYHQYALESYDLNAIDYLLKPIAFDRFLIAINKFKERFPQNESTEDNNPKLPNQTSFFFIKTEYKIVKVFYDDILYIEGLKDYLIVQTKDEKILTLQSFKNLMLQLPEMGFIRVHKSFVVAANKIESIERHRIKIKEKLIPISDTYKEGFYKMLKLNY